MANSPNRGVCGESWQIVLEGRPAAFDPRQSFGLLRALWFAFGAVLGAGCWLAHVDPRCGSCLSRKLQ